MDGIGSSSRNLFQNLDLVSDFEGFSGPRWPQMVEKPIFNIQQFRKYYFDRQGPFWVHPDGGILHFEKILKSSMFCYRNTLAV